MAAAANASQAVTRSRRPKPGPTTRRIVAVCLVALGSVALAALNVLMGDGLSTSPPAMSAVRR